jgi:pimeloyl-ACP methyl ester carboxylesterase
MTEPAELSFESAGERCAAWHWAGTGDAFAGDGGRPCVVMAHGFGHTADSGLWEYAERFAGEGLDVLLFDYRTFGASTGEPRQFVDYRRHRADYRAAIAHARTLPGVDADRIALWGSSYSGGHVVAVAADDPLITAVIAQVPAVDGRAAVLEIRRYAGTGTMLRVIGAGVVDAVRGLLRREPLRLPIVGPPGSLAAMSSPDSLSGSSAIQGPSFRNEYCARAALFAANNRPIKRVADVRCPILFQVAERDTVAPPRAAEKAAAKAVRCELRRYPLEHFEVYGGEGLQLALADQVEFLRRELQPRGARSAGRFAQDVVAPGTEAIKE